MFKIVLNKEAFTKILKEKNMTETEAAKHMGIDRSHLYRVLKGKQDPGRKFIEGVLKISDGYSLNDLFYVGNKITNKAAI